MKRFVLTVAAGLAAACASTTGALAAAADCPNGGTVRFGVEPYEAAGNLVPLFGKIGEAIGKQLDCKVEVFVATSYNAEIEAMRSGKLEFGEFGPLGYVLAHQVAKAEAIATFTDKEGKPATYTAGIVTWPGSGITELKQVAGRSFAYADPASTSGHLYPAMALKKAGIDPDKGIKGYYAGSHTASFEAIRNHKVDVAELNSEMITAATAHGDYKAADYVPLWTSDPIPSDAVAVRSDLPAGFKARLIKVMQNFDLSILTPEELKHLMGPGAKLVTTTDAAYNPVRELVDTLHIDLNKL